MRLLQNSSYLDRHTALWLLLLKVLMVLLIVAAIGIYLWYSHRIEVLEGKLRHYQCMLTLQIRPRQT